MKINIGPFFCASTGEPGRGALTPLNVCVEWASAHGAARLPLFQAHSEGLSKVRFHHILVHAEQIPCDAACPEYQVVEISGGAFVPVEAVLAAIYRNNEVDRDIREVLGEWGEFVSLHNSIRQHVPGDGLLLPSIEQAGFRVVNVLREGDEVLAELGWRPSKSINLFHTINCRLLVQGGTIIEDCWIEPDKAGITSLLAKEFRKSFPGSPKALMTKACVEHVVSLVARN